MDDQEAIRIPVALKPVNDERGIAVQDVTLSAQTLCA
jgi:hypothetical protein